VCKKETLGFTLIEMMIAVAIIGILAGIAVPAYNGYIDSTKLSTITSNLETLRDAEISYWSEHRTNTFVSGIHTAGDLPNTNILQQRLHWDTAPNDPNSYEVIAGPSGDIKTSIRIIATCPTCSTPTTLDYEQKLY